jgi:predicted flap endonuclease-1-like 5' DNA nuclease
MDMEEFRTHLKRRGKKEHVAQTLVGYVEQFAGYLREQRGTDLQGAGVGDLEAYADRVEDQRKGSARKVVRGIGLYYDLIGKQDLASCAWSIRETAITKTRKIFALKDFRGVDQASVQALAAEGIVNVEQMVAAGRTPALREALSQRTGVPLAAIVEYVKLSDLARIGGLRSVRVRLYYDAGVDTIDKLAAWDPEELRAMFVDFVARTGFDGIAPLPKETRNAVATARKLDRLVEY